MILCEFTPTGGEMIRCAMEDFANVHLWKSFIMSIASVKVSMPNLWGGYAAPTFSDIIFSPDMFADSWPPPAAATVRMIWINGDDETAGTVVFDGTAQRGEVAVDGIKYTLKRPENTTKIPAATVYADTLAGVMATLCGASFLNLSLNTTRARIPSPAVSHTTTEEQLTIDFASELCASFAHGFVIEGSTLYLVDMYDITMDQITVTEWDIREASNKEDRKYTTCKCGDYSVDSATVANGDELSVAKVFHGTESNILAALANILEIANRPRIEMKAAISEEPLTIGNCYLFTSNSTYLPLQMIMLASDIVYNFDSEELLATGAGAIA